MFKYLKEFFSSSSSDSGVTTKEKATARNEPYVNVVKVNIDKDNPSDGYFELEWNQVFIRQLIVYLNKNIKTLDKTSTILYN